MPPSGPDGEREAQPPPGRDHEAAGAGAGPRGRFVGLDRDRARALTSWCAEIIPAGRGRPSAADVAAAEYADQVCSASPPLRRALIGAVDDLDRCARGLSGQPFADGTRRHRIAALAALEAANPGAFGLVKGLVYEAYYADPAVLAQLERATGWRASNVLTGSAMAALDESLLRRVRSLPPGYRRET
jgi:Gluconate 2-dehydrogenase subunit 3